MGSNMNSLEGPGNIITVSREEFAKGPRRLENVTSLSRRALAPIFYMPHEEERLATVTQLPTALSEKVPPLNEVVELLVETDIVSGILEQLMTTDRRAEAEDIRNTQRALREMGYSTEEIQQYVIEYVETIDPDLFEKALSAAEILETYDDIVDLRTFASLRHHA